MKKSKYALIMNIITGLCAVLWLICAICNIVTLFGAFSVLVLITAILDLACAGMMGWLTYSYIKDWLAEKREMRGKFHE